MEKITSLAIKQRNHFKGKKPDHIILMKMGAFYVVFADDADLVHKVCGITITHQSGVNIGSLPFYALESNLKKLIQAGHCVAVCEEVQKPGDKIIKRDVVRITGGGINPAP